MVLCVRSPATWHGIMTVSLSKIGFVQEVSDERCVLMPHSDCAKFRSRGGDISLVKMSVGVTEKVSNSKLV